MVTAGADRSRARLHGGDLPIGAGVLIAPRWVLTCAHVVNAALGRADDDPTLPGEPVALDFPALKAPARTTGRVVAGGWFPPDPTDGLGDVAVLELDDAPPAGARPAALRTVGDLAGTAFRTTGFPRGGPEGKVAAGTVADRMGPGWQWAQLVSAHGPRVQRGFSGSPVWADAYQAVIGLVVCEDIGEPEARGGAMLPVDVLVDIWPPLGELVPTGILLDPAYSSHWGPHARGVTRSTDPGDYFVGRRRVLQEVADWLASPLPPGVLPGRLVTGSPGAGKSAVLARLVVLSDRAYRARHGDVLADVSRETLPPVGAIDVAVHAADLTLADVTSRIASVAGIPDGRPREVVAAVLDRDEPFTLVVDALDEAIGGGLDIARQLLRPLARAGRHSGVRVLVGARRHLAGVLGASPASSTSISISDGEAEADAFTTLDLDSDAYLEPGDLVGSINGRLLLEHTPDRHTPYRGRPELAERIARAVTRRLLQPRANGAFLIAQIVATTLADAAEAIDVRQRGWMQRLPGSVGAALDDRLAALGEADAQRARDLLRAIAYAEAPLPQGDLWVDLANTLARRTTYTRDDLAWLLASPGSSWLIQSWPRAGEQVYVLYHQALADHLRPPSQETVHQREIVGHLLKAVSPGAGRRNWRAAESYVRTHLATHALAAGRLDELIDDVEYLAHADPVILSLALSRLTAVDPTPQTYSRTAHRLVAERPAENAAFLELTARADGLAELADRFAALPLGQPWAAPWARWVAPQGYGLVGRLDEAVVALQAADLDGRPVVVSGSEDGSLRRWDLTDGVPIGGPMTGHVGRVTSLALGSVGDEPVVVSGGEDGTVRRWALSDGLPFGPPLRGHLGAVLAVSAGADGDRAVVVSAGDDGAVRRWSLLDGTAVGEPLAGHRGRIRALTLARTPQGTLIVSAGDDATVRRWLLSTGAVVGAPLVGHNGRVNALGAGVIDREAVVVSGGVDWTWRRWRATDGTSLGDPVTVHDAEVTALAVGELDGRPVVVSGGSDNNLCLWDAGEAQGSQGPPMSHDGTVNAVAVATVGGSGVIVSGGADCTIRRWEPAASSSAAGPAAAGPATDQASSQVGGVSTVAVQSVGDELVLVSGGGDRHLRRWGLLTGEPRGDPSPGHDDWVNGMCSALIGERPAVLSAGGDGTVRCWELPSARPAFDPLETGAEWVNSVDVIDLDGETIAVAGCSDGTIHRWSLSSGDTFGEPFAAGQESVLTVVTADLDGHRVVLSSGADGTIRRWDVETASPLGPPLAGHDAPVWGLCLTGGAGGPDGGRPQMAVSCDGAGRIRWWDLDAVRPVGNGVSGHAGDAFVVVSGRVDGCDLVFSAGGDGLVRVWQSPGTLVHTIPAGGGLMDLAFVPPRHLIVAGWRGMFLLTLNSSRL